MSRRKPQRVDVHRTYQRVTLVCRHHPGVPLGKVYRQQGRELLDAAVERLDGPAGETVLRVRCQPCLDGRERSSDLQVRWDRVRTALDELEVSGRHADTLTI